MFGEYNARGDLETARARAKGFRLFLLGLLSALAPNFFANVIWSRLFGG